MKLTHQGVPDISSPYELLWCRRLFSASVVVLAIATALRVVGLP